MLNEIEQFIREQDLIPPKSRVICAVSGGADSICVLHIVYRLRAKLDFQLAAAHFNHMLRGEESDRDAAFVHQFRNLCCGQQRLPDGTLLPSVPLYMWSRDVAVEAKRRGTGIEETARDLRYEFLRAAAELFRADRIATAHTANDNIETILFHLARGSGLRGMAGILPVGNGLIRPLLAATRQQVEDYLAYQGLPYVEDSSNADDAYARNRIRHQVVPVLEELYPGFARRTTETACLLRADEELLSRQAAELSGQARAEGGRLAIAASLIASAPAPVAVRAVRQLIGRLNGGDQDCAAPHLEAVVRLCREEGSPSAQANLPRGLTARREYRELVLSREPAPSPLPETGLALPGVTGVGSWEITCTRQVYEGQPQGAFEFWLSQALAPALTARSRRRGDRLTLSRRPEKTLKKWYIDEKIPRARRDCLPVLECAGQTAAAAGLGPNRLFSPGEGEAAWHFVLKEREHADINSGKEENSHARERHPGDIIQ